MLMLASVGDQSRRTLLHQSHVWQNRPDVGTHFWLLLLEHYYIFLRAHLFQYFRPDGYADFSQVRFAQKKH